MIGDGAGLCVRALAVAPAGAHEPVLTRIDFELTPGEWLALEGPNGSGKTTLVMTLAGLIPPHAGEVVWKGRDPRDAEARKTIATVLQEPASQLLAASVREEVALAARHLGHADGRVAAVAARLIEALDLGRDLERDPRALSAGRQQLVLLAAALAEEPSLLIADEVTAHLDAPSRLRALAEVRRAAAAGTAIVWVTQDEAELAAAHRVLSLGAAGGDRPATSARGLGARVGRDRATAGSPEAPVASAVQSVAAGQVRLRPSRVEEGPGVRIRAPITVELPAKGLVALAGPNGVGKSVILGALAGVGPAAGVEIDWRQRPGLKPLFVGQYPEEQMFEEIVRDEILFTALQRGLRRDRAETSAAQLVAELGFESQDLLAARAWSLSAGEKRLVATAAALLAPGWPLLLDEPSAGLDPIRKKALTGSLRARAQTDLVLVASQDLPWLEASGFRVFQLEMANSAAVTSPSKKTD